MKYFRAIITVKNKNKAFRIVFRIPRRESYCFAELLAYNNAPIIAITILATVFHVAASAASAGIQKLNATVNAASSDIFVMVFIMQVHPFCRKRFPVKICMHDQHPNFSLYALSLSMPKRGVGKKFAS